MKRTYEPDLSLSPADQIHFSEQLQRGRRIASDLPTALTIGTDGPWDFLAHEHEWMTVAEIRAALCAYICWLSAVVEDDQDDDCVPCLAETAPHTCTPDFDDELACTGCGETIDGPCAPDCPRSAVRRSAAQ